ADVHNNLGLALTELGRPKEAVEHCRRALALNPHLAGAHNNLANALKQLARLDEAVAHYQKAPALQPHFAPAHYNLGVTLRRQGKIPQALTRFTRALEIDRGFVAAEFARCMAQLPILYEDEPEIARCRAAYRQNLIDLRQGLGKSTALPDLA